MRSRLADIVRTKTIALIGNPNSGKTTLFNSLTGMRQKVGNYPGVTVEKKEGRIFFEDGSDALAIDLPGTYSLTANSPDERIATDVLLGRIIDTPPPDVVLCVVDASNIERNLYLASQIIDRQIPVVIALNMIDAADRDGTKIDVEGLSRELGVPIVATIASKGVGISELKRALSVDITSNDKSLQWQLPDHVKEEYEELVGLLQRHHQLTSPEAFHEAAALLTGPSAILEHQDRFAPELIAHVRRDHARLDFLGIDRESVFVEARYDWIQQVCTRVVTKAYLPEMSFSDKIDFFVTHKVWGFAIFIGVMALLFQTIFSWATLPMELIADGFDQLSNGILAVMPPGDLRNLIIDGGLAGVSSVVTFLPQIMFLFLFIGILEDTGYMSRAAFIMDRLMGRVGLHGKAFIPLLSSFACAIPGLMATRTIESHRDRLLTMLVLPLVSCSARLPIFVLMIAAFVPQTHVLGFISLPAIVLLSMFLLGLGTSLGMAWLFKKTLLKGKTPVFIMELPPYKFPSIKTILLQMWERSLIFLKTAGTIILGASIILWFLANYPRVEGATPAEQIHQSFAGQLGHTIEPVIRPLGFDWKIGIGLVGSILQREVFVSTLGTIYNIQGSDNEEGLLSLTDQLQSDKNPVTGAPTYTLLTALCVMVYYVLAMQCLSTIAVMRRETNGWKWPLFQFGYMTGLAYSVTFIVYRLGLILGIGG